MPVGEGLKCILRYVFLIILTAVGADIPQWIFLLQSHLVLYLSCLILSVVQLSECGSTIYVVKDLFEGIFFFPEFKKTLKDTV